MFWKRDSSSNQPMMNSPAGDPAAFSALYRSHVDRVYRYCLFRTGSQQDAQDLTSQIFMAAWENMHDYRAEGSVGGWLIGIARHKTADYLRRVKRTVSLESMADFQDNRMDIGQQVALRLSVEQVLQHANTLAPDRAEAFSLRFLAGLSNAEIATMMGKNEAAVRMLIHRALTDLRQRLTPLMEPEVVRGQNG